MDMTLLGETLVLIGDESYYGFWMPAGGNDGVAGAEVFYNSVANACTVHLETKSSDAADSGAASIGSVSISSTSAATYKFDVTNAKDLVRYRVEGVNSGRIHLQFAQPLWQPN